MILLFKIAGPFTLFVPSNEALQKIPDVDLDFIRNNMTALKGELLFLFTNNPNNFFYIEFKEEIRTLIFRHRFSVCNLF